MVKRDVRAAWVVCICMAFAALAGWHEAGLKLDPVDGCTSWAAVGSATASGNTILHKNRDDTRYSKQVIGYFKNANPRPAKNTGFVGLVISFAPSSVGAGINRCGLAVACNVVDGAINPGKVMTSVVMNKNILENCGDVASAYAYLDANKNKLYNEAIFFFADRTCAAVVECCMSATSGMKIKGSLEECLLGKKGRPQYAGRANRFEDFPSFNTFIDLTSHNRRRFESVMDYLARHDGTLSPLECFELSREHRYPDNKDDDRDGNTIEMIYSESNGAVCSHFSSSLARSTVGGVTFEIDSLNPELSVMWFAAGPPDSTVYIPIHVSFMNDSDPQGLLKASCPEWTTTQAYDRTEEIRKYGWWREGTFDACRQGFLSLEARMTAAEIDARENARVLMNAGRAEEAFALLADFDAGAARHASSFLGRITDSVPPGM